MTELTTFEAHLLGEVWVACDRYIAKKLKNPKSIGVTGWMKGGINVARMELVAREWEANYKKKPEA